MYMVSFILLRSGCLSFHCVYAVVTTAALPYALVSGACTPTIASFSDAHYFVTAWTGWWVQCSSGYHIHCGSGWSGQFKAGNDCTAQCTCPGEREAELQTGWGSGCWGCLGPGVAWKKWSKMLVRGLWAVRARSTSENFSGLSWGAGAANYPYVVSFTRRVNKSEGASPP